MLVANARWLKSNPTASVLIEGHCDERGTREYNLALGDRRAKATRDDLVSLGIDGSRMTLISYGKERPLCSERTEACWAQNRRAHFLVKQQAVFGRAERPGWRRPTVTAMTGAADPSQRP
jgi:peptidoglycan-associated lipoprotein